MELGIGRICVALCLGAAGACCIGVIALERRMESMMEVAAEPAIDGPEVAAVIQWAREEGAGVWKASMPPESPSPEAAQAAPIRPISRQASPLDLARALHAAGGHGSATIAVPQDARAGGGKVSSIPGGRLAGGGSSRVMSNAFARALNRQMAPRLRSSTTSRRR